MLISLVLLSLNQARPVVFDYDASRLKSIWVNGVCILGDEIRTTGGYFIGSADGSDAQGHSVTSVNALHGHLLSDDPTHIVPPPFHMTFQPMGEDRLKFIATVGPAPQRFETLSLPFDFGRKIMERFSFPGDHYTLFSAENDGTYQGSGNLYDFIKPKGEIRDIHQTLIGKVGGASTDAPSSWGQVDGPFAQVRITVSSSHHYEKLVFFNHPGTHNMEFAFGRFNQGESASISGEIAVVPKRGPDQWVFDAAKEFNHQIGRAEADGWSAKVGDEREKYMCFGPYATEVGAGPRVATWNVMFDNVTFDNYGVLTLDVAEARSGRVLASRDVRRNELAKPMEYQPVSLPFYAPYGSKLEFRALWHGASYTRIKDVQVTRG